MTRGKRSTMMVFDDMMDDTSLDDVVDKYIESISKPTGVSLSTNDKLDYSELRKEIHKIL